MNSWMVVAVGLIAIPMTACGGASATSSSDDATAVVIDSTSPKLTLTLGDNKFESLWINNAITR